MTFLQQYFWSVNNEVKIIFFIFISIIMCFIWSIKLFKKTKQNKSDYHISVNLLISWCVLLIFFIPIFISFILWNKYYFELFWFLWWFLFLLFSWIHGYYYRKEIKNITAKRFILMSIPASIITFIPLVLYIFWYFDK